MRLHMSQAGLQQGLSCFYHGNPMRHLVSLRPWPPRSGSQASWVRPDSAERLHSRGRAQCGAVSTSTAQSPSALAGRLPIAPGEVHLWWLHTAEAAAQPGLLERCAKLLPAGERAEAEAAGNEALRRERLLARALTRWSLSHYLSPGSDGPSPPGELLFQRGPHGKPRLVAPSRTTAGHALQFNLTHTAGLIGVAVAAQQLVGLDVEPAARRPRADPLRLARRRFSPAEIADLEALSDDAERAQRFLEVWTLKEAYVKALGRGISSPPGIASFSFRLPDEQARRVTFESEHADGRRWRFLLLQPAAAHVAALCVERAAGDDGSTGPRLRSFRALPLGEPQPEEGPEVLAAGEA